MPFEFDNKDMNFAKIKVFGVGGAGNNAVNRMIESDVKGAEFIAVNTDKQTLLLSKAESKIQIGEKLTKGLGAGGNPEVGKKSAEESIDDLNQAIDGSNLVFIACGLGGGTGTGAAPVIAQLAQEYKKKEDCLIIAVTTLPFDFEGLPRARAAEKGLAELTNYVDSIITIPNNKLLGAVGKGTSLVDAFKVADEVLQQAVQGIVDLIVKPALIKLDFADVRTVMSKRGAAHIGIGIGYGENKTLDAAKLAIQSPLLETNINGAKGILLNITGDATLGLHEVQEAARMIQAAADPDADILFGACIDASLDDEVRITVIATGFDEDRKPQVSIPVKNEPKSFASAKDEIKETFPAKSKETITEFEDINPVVYKSYDEDAFMSRNKDVVIDKKSEISDENTSLKYGSNAKPIGLDLPPFFNKKPRRN